MRHTQVVVCTQLVGRTWAMGCTLLVGHTQVVGRTWRTRLVGCTLAVGHTLLIGECHAPNAHAVRSFGCRQILEP